MAERGSKKKPKKPKKALVEKAENTDTPEPESAKLNLKLPIMLHKRVRLFSLVEGKTLQESVTELIETGLNAWDNHHDDMGSGGGCPHAGRDPGEMS